MSDLIDRQQAIDAIHEDADWLAAQGSDWQVERMERDKSILKSLPTVQPNHNADTGKMVGDCISRQAAIDAVIEDWHECCGVYDADTIIHDVTDIIENLPPVQPKIIHCKDCKHWNLQVGNVKGDGLGSCDFHNVNFVTGEGFCYWAEKRGEADDH